MTAANYILLDSSVTNFSSNLPLVIIDTVGQTIPDGSKIGSYTVFINTNMATGRATLGSPGDYIGRLGIGLHGSSSLGFPKKPYTIELDDESGNSVNHKLLGLPPASDWLPYLAKVAGARPPLRVPAWAARLLAGDAAVLMMLEGRGFSNAKAKALFPLVALACWLGRWCRLCAPTMKNPRKPDSPRWSWELAFLIRIRRPCT